jgi:hypothetical protein
MGRISMGKRLLKMKECISGMENNPEIQSLLDEYGYTYKRISEGKMMLDKVNDLISIQAEEYSDQYVASSEFSKFWDKTYAKYMITLKVIRVAFTEQPEMLRRFNATGSRNRSLGGWLQDAKIMYSNVLKSPESLEIMSQYGYKAERLNNEFQEVLEVEQLHIKQLGEKGIAQYSTQEKNEAFDELCKWFSKFRAIVRIALYEKPQLMEALGITKK